MGRSRAALLTVLIVGASGIVQAQILNLTAYRWEAADLALAYPAAWDAPVESEQEGRLTLELSQTLALRQLRRFRSRWPGATCWRRRGTVRMAPCSRSGGRLS